MSNAVEGNKAKSRMPEIVEAVFDIGYLLFDLVAAIVFFVRADGRTVFLLYGALTLILGGGDAFHLLPRVSRALHGTSEKTEWRLGLGLAVSSVTAGADCRACLGHCAAPHRDLSLSAEQLVPEGRQPALVALPQHAFYCDRRVSCDSLRHVRQRQWLRPVADGRSDSHQLRLLSSRNHLGEEKSQNRYADDSQDLRLHLDDRDGTRVARQNLRDGCRRLRFPTTAQNQRLLEAFADRFDIFSDETEIRAFRIRNQNRNPEVRHQ